MAKTKELPPFEGFCEQTGDFLWGIAFHNERSWFLAHKEEYERVLNRPFRILASQTLERMRQRFPKEDWQVHISRIYRDARRLYGRGPYKDHLWFTVYTDERNEGPSFWF
jgi:uncharacterized protein (DUF2461 family)